jgi:hypothetical protein
MKSISNRRKYKLFLKDIQRNSEEGYFKIKTFFAEKGVLIDRYYVYEIFNKLTPLQFNRFMKLCTRIGGAAKKRNLFIKAYDVYNGILNDKLFVFDPLKIVFYKVNIEVENIKRTWYTFSPENHEYSQGRKLSISRKEEKITENLIETFTLVEMINNKLI